MVPSVLDVWGSLKPTWLGPKAYSAVMNHHADRFPRPCNKTETLDGCKGLGFRGVLLFRGSPTPLPHPAHGLLAHGMAEQAGQHDDLAAVMAVVGQVIRQEGRGVVREARDAAAVGERRGHDALHGPALRAPSPHGLGGGGAGAIELRGGAGRAGGARRG